VFSLRVFAPQLVGPCIGPAIGCSEWLGMSAREWNPK
jgi:hypothetical protein